MDAHQVEEAEVMIMIGEIIAEVHVQAMMTIDQEKAVADLNQCHAMRFAVIHPPKAEAALHIADVSAMDGVETLVAVTPVVVTVVEAMTVTEDAPMATVAAVAEVVVADLHLCHTVRFAELHQWADMLLTAEEGAVVVEDN